MKKVNFLSSESQNLKITSSYDFSDGVSFQTELAY